MSQEQQIVSDDDGKRMLDCRHECRETSPSKSGDTMISKCLACGDTQIVGQRGPRPWKPYAKQRGRL